MSKIKINWFQFIIEVIEAIIKAIENNREKKEQENHN